MIKFEKLNIINNKDMKEILDTWESSVRATHDFLSEEKIISIKLLWEYMILKLKCYL